ncbi:MAG: type I DNA topoisomerase [Bacteroidia bacterium]|nr:type I DNA topoisomerase [Bacteroidia bacterium]
MSKNLVIVESPAKAKTIEGFLGKDFTVRSSFGHVRDLPRKGKVIDIENDFSPTYEVSEDKEKVVADLIKLAKGAEMIWLATDEDREGEAISWHLSEALNLTKANTKRIVFHEITKPAILKAIQNPRGIDINLVNAQQARRILDRLVGFELSPILWKKIKPSLSAGRVQSVAVRLIVEREREITKFKTTSAYRVVALFNVGTAVLKAELDKRFATKPEAQAFLEKCKPATFTIGNLETKPAKRSPAAPFTTSTLQQEAARKLGFSVAQTMVVAQKLYESGKITYMRTDSVNLSETALNQAHEEITTNYGAKYHHKRVYKTKSKGAQEAHEAIRPTYLNVTSIDSERNEMRLYDLIWKRTIASQMADAELEKTTATVLISTATEKFIAQGEVLKFDGFLKVYLEGTDEEGEGEDMSAAQAENSSMLPPMKVGEKLEYSEIVSTEKYTHHPARFTEASLVKKLEELGIGRPSTYAPTISTVQKRNYVVKEDRMGTPRNYSVLSLVKGKIADETKTENTGAEKSKMFPTDIGMVVNDFLMQYFPDILDFHFTAKVEEEFDEIAEGKLVWTKMLKDFYKPFHKTVEKTTEHSERASGERLLGVDTATGKNVYVRIGRFGPMVQLGESTDEIKPRFASLRNDQRLESITFEQALDLFRLPRVVGQFEDKDVRVSIGRFGPYTQHDGKFVSLKKEDDPYEVSLERCIELIEAKRIYDIERILKTFPEDDTVKILKGRWGPFIARNKENYRIPKGTDYNELTYEDVFKIMGPVKEVKVVGKKGKAKKAAVKKLPKEKVATVKKAAAKKASPKKVSAKKDIKTLLAVKKVVKKKATKKAAKKKA